MSYKDSTRVTFRLTDKQFAQYKKDSLGYLQRLRDSLDFDVSDIEFEPNKTEYNPEPRSYPDRRKVRAADVLEMKKLRHDGFSYQDIAERLGMSYSTCRDYIIGNGRNKL